MAKYYRIDSTSPAYANRFGLTGRDKYVYANSPSEARRTAIALIGPNLPSAALLVEEVPAITGSTAIEKGTGELLNYQPTGQQVTSVDPTGYIPSEFEEGLGVSGISLGLGLPQTHPPMVLRETPTGNVPFRQTAVPQGFGYADELFGIDPSTAGGSGSFTNFTNGLTNASVNDLINAHSRSGVPVVAPPNPVTPTGDTSFTYGDSYTPPNPVGTVSIPADINTVSTGAIPMGFVDFDKEGEEKAEQLIRLKNVKGDEGEKEKEKEKEKEENIPFGWTNNISGWNQLSPEQQAAARTHNLNSMKELENYYNQINMDLSSTELMNIDDIGGTKDQGSGDPNAVTGLASDGTGSADPVVVIDPMQELLNIDPMGSTTGDPNAVTGLASDGTGGTGDANHIENVVNFAKSAANVPVWSSQDMIDDPDRFLTEAGRRLAFRNVFGEPATGVGPLASFLQRQNFPLTEAYRAQTFADMGRQEAGKYVLAPDAYPKVSFENFLRSVRDRPTGLGGTYGQALQNVNYLRGLEGSEVPTALAGVFNPEQSANTWDARNLLEAAQRGKYSGLVSRSFRQPTQDDLFSDYVLAKQDAATAGTAPQNFLNFAASRYGL